eukprot:CAMPEP_0172196790 /NCGR_PEP_ID=MMETSP1050-20130122/27037_1 /TAXON_ID=233186 /ORGANISM="Cryptomonas curvata, Strain CCAP979/52" /LENGTH=95 /DNA_ID=CAMNT_0012873159 /DNA_START=326 /DNA_END=610 /DNA_ORIENTATION=+
MGILLVYDVTNEQSFRNIEEWMTNIEKHTMYPVDKILIGSKTDLVSQRKITTEYRGRATAGSAAGYTLPGDFGPGQDRRRRRLPRPHPHRPPPHP